MANDKVARPVNKDREGGLKQVKTSIIEGPTVAMDNLTPYNRTKKSKKY